MSEVTGRKNIRTRATSILIGGGLIAASLAACSSNDEQGPKLKGEFAAVDCTKVRIPENMIDPIITDAKQLNKARILAKHIQQSICKINNADASAVVTDFETRPKKGLNHTYMSEDNGDTLYYQVDDELDTDQGPLLFSITDASFTKLKDGTANLSTPPSNTSNSTYTPSNVKADHGYKQNEVTVSYTSENGYTIQTKIGYDATVYPVIDTTVGVDYSLPELEKISGQVDRAALLEA